MGKSNLTYRKSGVNIKAADKFVNYISSLAKKHNKSKESKNIGGFGSISKIPKYYSNGYLVASTDGVGTKIEIANDLSKFKSIKFLFYFLTLFAARLLFYRLLYIQLHLVQIQEIIFQNYNFQYSLNFFLL